jgi:hypothetical protein
MRTPRLSLVIPKQSSRVMTYSLSEIDVVVLDFDQTLARTHIFHLLTTETTPEDLGQEPFMNSEDKSRIRDLFSFFEKNSMEVFIASRNYKDVIQLYLAHAGVSIDYSHIWTDRGCFFSHDTSHHSKHGCIDYLQSYGKRIMYIDDDNKEIRHVTQSHPTVFAVEKPSFIPLTVSFVCSQF